MIKHKYKLLLSFVLLAAVLITSCSGEVQQAQTGDTVQVHYTGKLQDGAVFDSTEGSEPIEFTLGQGQIIPGFEQAVTGIQLGESRTVNVPVDQAYGPRNDNLIQEVSREQLPEDIQPEVGMQLQRILDTGETLVVTITEVNDATITIDANPPLAGKDLIFDIKLVGIGAKSLQSGSTGATGAVQPFLPFSEALSSGKPTLAEFGSNSCIPCKQMKPILEQLSVDYQDKLNVVIVEVYDHQDLARQYKVLGIPTQIILDSGGKEIARHVGLWPREQIITQLNKLGIK